LKEKQYKASVALQLYTNFLSKVSKVDYSSKAKSSNIHYFVPLIDTVNRWEARGSLLMIAQQLAIATQ
jgi:hypothetical protein